MVSDSQGKTQHGERHVGKGLNTPESSLITFRKAESKEWCEKKDNFV